jgi:hypothetical protein
MDPLLGKDLETNNVTNAASIAVAVKPVSRQWIGKHVPAATTTHTTVELLLETVFSTRSVQSAYNEDNWGNPVSNTVPGGITGPPWFWGI